MTVPKLRYYAFLVLLLAMSVASSPTTMDQIPNTINQFSLEFYKETADRNSDKNLVMSPLSAEVLLGLLSVGARGDTQKEINDALHFNNSDIIKSTFKSKMGKLTSTEGVILNIANKIYVKDGESYALASEFKTVAVDDFSSDVQNIDFSKAEQATSTINEWVESKTNDKIKNFMSPDTLDAATRLILVNAIYFQGNWDKPFEDADVRKTKFNKNETEEIDVQMMSQTDEFPFAKLPEWDADIISLPYKNKDMYLTIILPRKVDGLKALEEKIYSVNIVDVLNKMKLEDVHLSLPKFKIESTIDLKRVLPELGMKLIFDQEKAELHNLLKSNDTVFVSEAKQKAFIEVNEHGTEAGAVTELRIVPSSARFDEIYFYIDHPFFYMLMHKEDIIFCGKYIGA